MGNNKILKTATAVALGTSVVATAVAPGAASAATTYKLKSGKLYQVKNGKTTLVKGFKTYKKVLYKNGKKYTGLRSAKYYKAGVLATGTYKGVKYKKGIQFTGVSANGKYYKNGVVGTGTYKGVKYKKGIKFAGVSTNGKLYEDGVVATGTKLVEDTLYVDGVVATGTVEFEDIVYVNGKKDVEAPVITAEDKTVAYGSEAVDVATLATVEDNSKEEIKATATITFDGKEVSAIDTKTPGKYTVTYVAKDKSGLETKKEIIVTVAEAEKAEVESVTAINAKELKVTFNKAVSKDSLQAADFAVTATGASSTTVTVSDIQLSADGKTATLLLASAIPAAGLDIKVVAGDILTSTFDKFEAFATTAVKAPTDKVAPKLVSAVTDGSNVVLTFDEPVDFTNAAIKVNQQSVSTTVASLTSTKAGVYTYTVAASNIKSGSNDLEITNIADFASNKETLISTAFTHSVDTSAPAAKSIKAVGQYSFLVEFSKVVAIPTDANFEITKGNLVLDSSYFDTFEYADENGKTTDASNNTITSSKYVLVTLKESATNVANPIYGANESSVDLAVKVKGYKDTQTTPVLGADFASTVKLTTDAVAPKVVSEKLITSVISPVPTTGTGANDTITIPFDEALDTATASIVAANVTVKAGTVKITPTSVTVSGNTLVLAFANGTLSEDVTYSILLGEGTVKDTAGNKNASVSLTHTVKSSATYDDTVTASGNIAIDAVTKTKNIIDVNYVSKVSDEAANLATYKLNGEALPEGTEIYFTSSAKTAVKIVLPDSYKQAAQNKAAKLTIAADTVQYDATAAYVSGSDDESTPVEAVLLLNDNVAPTVEKVEYVKNAAGLATGLKVTFSEAVKDSTVDPTKLVVKQGTTAVATYIPSGVTGDTANDNVVYVNFGTAVAPVALTATDVTLATTADVAIQDANDNVLKAITTAIAAQ